MNRALCLTLLGLAVVVAAGCGGQSSAEPHAWAADVCAQLSAYEGRATAIWTKAQRGPAREDLLPEPYDWRVYAAPRISAASRAFVDMLAALRPPRGDESGTQWQTILALMQGRVRDGTAYVQPREARLIELRRKGLSASAEDVEAVESALEDGISFLGHGGFDVATLVGVADGELRQALRADRACRRKSFDLWVDGGAKSGAELSSPGSQSSPPPLPHWRPTGGAHQPGLTGWASDVCKLFTEHEAAMKDVYKRYGKVQDAPQLASPSMVLASLREGRQVGRDFSTRLKGIQSPQEVSRLWRRLIEQHFILQDWLNDLNRIEGQLEPLPSTANRVVIERHIDDVGSTLAQIASAPSTIAQYVGIAKRVNRRLTKAFRNADTCKPYAKAIDVGAGTA